MFSLAIPLLLSTLASVSALPNPHVVGPQPEPPAKRSALPTSWFHKRDHPVHDLFRRQSPSAEVGSPEWANQYPRGAPESDIPAAWLAALDAAVAANRIPNLPLATSNDGGQTANYAPSDNAGQEPICSAQYQCRADDDIWDAPDGYIGLSVDDGPVGIEGASATLYDFLERNNQKVTHFMIGENIRNNPDLFLRAFRDLDNDIAVHTWSHRHSSILTNEQLVAELGWTLQIISDSTGGRVPRYWRPPYGDVDNRVRAVAREVFGLTTVIWNQDSKDWTMAATPPGTTLDRIQTDFTGWLNGPRSPGLIVLEHEVTADDVRAFMNMYPLIAAATGGEPWKAVSVAQLFDGHETGWDGEGWYLNADNNTSPVDEMDIIGSGYHVTVTATQTDDDDNHGGSGGTGTRTGSASGTPTQTVNTGAAIRSVAVTTGAAGLAAVALIMSFVL